MLNALSFDLEEWYHAEFLREHIPPSERISQVEQATEPILDILARRNVRATFFVVGEIARDHPGLMQAILEGGHEIACHGMMHRPLWDMTPEAFQAELREFRSTTSRFTVIGFRAPTFSIGQKTRWALPILAEEGFLYDSSIFPVANYMYGLNGAPLVAYRPSADDLRLTDPDGLLVELPMTAWQVGGLRLPVSGGFYLRAVPIPILVHALRQVTRNRPIVLYMHPWEACEKTPIVPGLRPLERFITYYNRSSTLSKLERLLDEFAFAPLCDVLSPMLSATTPAVAGARPQASSHPATGAQP